MMRKVLLVGAVVLLGVGLAGATTLLKMDFDDLARDADYIVVGTVESVTGERDEGARFIHSNVYLSVERSYRGNAPAQIVIRTPGGEIGGVAMRADGAASFEVGEKVLVFLTTWEDGTAKVLGYAQGKSRVVRDDGDRPVLVGGVASGRSLDAVSKELRHGPELNIPLRPVR
jgi:hypothetical protein